MVQIFSNPLLEKTEAAEIDDEATLIEALTAKLDLDGPIVAMQEGAMPLMPMLAMGERDIPIGFAAGEHAQRRIRRAHGPAARHIMSARQPNGQKRGRRIAYRLSLLST